LKLDTKIITFFVLVVSLLTISNTAGAVMYSSYYIDYYKTAVPAPHAYVPSRIIYGADLGVGELKSPQDVYTAGDAIYIVDTGNNRIIKTDLQFNVVQVIQQFQKDGQKDSLSSPYGVCVDKYGQLWIADKGNNRIVCLDAEGNFVKEVTSPHVGYETMFPDHFRFRPNKILVDKLDRIYVIVDGLYEGILQLDMDGSFRGFIGAPSVNPSWWDYFWSVISSDEQRKRSRSFLPTEYSNMDLDADGLIFTTISGGEIIPEQRIRRLNPRGIDVLNRGGVHPPMGEVRIRDYLSTDATSGPSMLVDVATRENGMYSVLCRRRGRIYTYSANGDFLYVFGGTGQGAGLVQTATALAAVGDRLLVVDAGLNRITVFDPTEYAMLIHEALGAYERGDFAGATELWRQVLARNANNELAYVGIGKNLLDQAITKGTDPKDYIAAMQYFKLGNNREGYSDAFYRYRRAVIDERFSYIMSAVVIIILAGYLAGKFQLKSRIRSGWHRSRLYRWIASERVQNNRIYRYLRQTWQALKYAKHVAFHPFDGFWDLKHEKRGNASAATVILVLVVLTYVFLRQYLGYVFNTNKPDTLNIYIEIASVAIPFFIWCVVNWSLTTLMDGKGTMRDIYIASAYALTPIILVYIPAIIISNFLTLEEGSFLYLALTVGALWAVALLVLGTMVTHDYEMTKTLLIVLAIIVGIAAVIFVSLLFFMVIDLLLQFVTELYSEFAYRLH